MVVWSKGIIYIYHTLSLSLYGCPYTYIYIIYMATIHVAISLAIYFTLIWNVNLLRLQKHRKTTMAFGWLTQGVCQMRASPRSLHPVESYVLLLVNVLEVLETCMWTAQLSSTINSMRSSFFWGFLVLTATWQPPSTKKNIQKARFFLVVRSCMKRYKKLPNLEEKQPFFWGKNTTSMASRDTKLQLGSVRSIWHNSFRKRHSHTRQASWRGELVDMASFQSIQQSHLKMLSHPNLVGGFNALILCHVSVKHLHLSSLKVSYILHHHSKPWYCWWLKSC